MSGLDTQVDPHAVGRLDVRAGDLHLEARRNDGGVIDALDFVTDNQSVFYNLDGARCYGVVDATAVYAQGGAPPDPLVLIDTIAQADRIYHIPAGRFVRPGGILPVRTTAGTRVIWIERAGCDLLASERQHLWLAQLMVRHDDRRERRRAAAERARALQGGGP